MGRATAGRDAADRDTVKRTRRVAKKYKATVTQPYYKFVITQVTVPVYQLEVFSKLSSMSLGPDVSNVTGEQRASKASTEMHALASRRSMSVTRGGRSQCLQPHSTGPRTPRLHP